jgi:hypothetical protein
MGVALSWQALAGDGAAAWDADEWKLDTGIGVFFFG